VKFKKLNIHYKLFKNESFEILEEPNGDCYIHDLVDDRYFVKEKSNILAYSNNKEIKDVYWSKIDTIYVILIIFSIVQLLVILNYLFSEQLAVDNEVGYSLVFLIFNVVFHELGHNISLRIFKKRPGKYKLHFFFIFPVLSLNTNGAYMLPKFEKVCVFYSGILINIIICFIYFIFNLNTEHIQVMIPTIGFILFNIFPFGKVETDGYHIFITTLLDKKKVKRGKSDIEIILTILFYLSIFFITVFYFIAILKIVSEYC
jgi:putative peptide zinc metalloprotease protein